MARLHLADNNEDASRTRCNQIVGYVLTELEEDVTADRSALLHSQEACKDCLDEEKG